jgi:hypothetical protein
MRRIALLTALLLSLTACGGEPESVSHVVRYELNMVGDRAFADITASYTDATGFDTNAKVFAASWSHEVKVTYPEVEWVRLLGTLAFDTPVPGEPTAPQASQLRCRIQVDGRLVVELTGFDPRCTFRLSTTISPSPSAG